MNLDIDVEECRERDGDAREDRDADVEDLFEWEQLGYGIGEPLAAESYDVYPDRHTDLSGAKWRPLLVELLSSPAVRDWDDAVRELFSGYGDTHLRRKWTQALKRATDAYSVDSSALFARGNPNDLGGPQNALTTLTSDLSKHVVREDNPLCLAYLYGGRPGLSCSEIDALFQSPDGTARKRLHSIGLVTRKEDRPEGKTTDDLLVEPRTDAEGVEENDIKLGGANIQAVREDPNVTVVGESDE